MYYAIQSTVTKIKIHRLLCISHFLSTHYKTKIMRTLNSNQVSGTLKGTKSNVWNSKRRYR